MKFGFISKFSVVIVTGGMQTLRVTRTRSSGALKSVELLYTNGTHRCFLPDLPQGRHYPSQTGLITCASSDSGGTKKTCVTFSEGSWQHSHTLAGQGRHGNVAWASPQGVLLMGASTTELLTENGDTTPSFDLDYPST